MRAESVFLNSRSDELDAHKSRIEIFYRTMCRENSTAFGTPHAYQDLEDLHLQNYVNRWRSKARS